MGSCTHMGGSKGQEFFGCPFTEDNIAYGG